MPWSWPATPTEPGEPEQTVRRHYFRASFLGSESAFPNDVDRLVRC